jgi:tRNA-intron endonuclease
MADEEQPDKNSEESETGDREPEKEEAPVLEKPKAFLSDSNVVIKKDTDAVYGRVFYGTKEQDGTLRLSPVETMFLLERGRIDLVEETTGSPLNLYQYLQRSNDMHPDLWTHYLVYRDLRSRGYIVKEGVSEEIPFRVYPRGGEIGRDTSKYLICIVKEGVPIELTRLDKATSTAKGVGKRLILAVLNRQGEATYYQVSQVSI